MHTARKGYRCIPIQLRTQCIRILSHQKSLMTENDRDLNDRILGRKSSRRKTK